MIICNRNLAQHRLIFDPTVLPEIEEDLEQIDEYNVQVDVNPFDQDKKRTWPVDLSELQPSHTSSYVLISQEDCSTSNDYCDHSKLAHCKADTKIAHRHHSRFPFERVRRLPVQVGIDNAGNNHEKRN